MSSQNTYLKVFVVIVVVLLIGGFLWRYLTKDEGATVATNSADKADALTQNANGTVAPDTGTQLPKQPKKINMRTLSNFTPVSKTTTLQKIDLVIGTGELVSPGATVSVHYTGAVAATGEVFQSSKDFGTNPITFPLSGVIKGWTDGIPGMKVGGTRRLVIPAAQAYGATPPPGSGIPANADLVFDVELVATSQ